MEVFQLLMIAGVAILVLARLYAVLGRDAGAPPPAQTPSLVPGPLEKEQDEKPFEPAFAGHAALVQADPGFETDEFLEGAKTAYEMVVAAFAGADKQTLQELLDESVFETYSKAIDDRQAAGKSLQIDIVRMQSPKIIESEIEDGTTFVTVEFHTDLTVLEQQEGENDEETKEDAMPFAESSETTEQWTFCRQTGSRNPNWKLGAVAAIA